MFLLEKIYICGFGRFFLLQGLRLKGSAAILEESDHFFEGDRFPTLNALNYLPGLGALGFGECCEDFGF